jgi:hypothetical protein
MAGTASRNHPFSIEISSRGMLHRFSYTEETAGALVEGELGSQLVFQVVEDIMLEITGENGVFRLDLGEGDAEKIRLLLSGR